jgi:hypothetical protein
MKDREKKEQGTSPARKIVSTLYPPKIGLIFIDGVTLLVRVGLLPRLGPPGFQPCGWPEDDLVDHLFRLVIIFGNDCSKYGQSAK